MKMERIERITKDLADARDRLKMEAMAMRFEATGWEPAEVSRITATIFRCAKEHRVDVDFIEAAICEESA